MPNGKAFDARDTDFGGFTDQDRTRTHQSLTLEWRGETGALHRRRRGPPRHLQSLPGRHDSLRASSLAKLGAGFAVAGTYGEGIAQPTFFDLYGFFPGSFVGNPALKPESSRRLKLRCAIRRGPVRRRR